VRGGASKGAEMRAQGRELRGEAEGCEEKGIR